MNIPKNYIFKYDWLPAEDCIPVSCVICKGQNDETKEFSFKLNERIFSIQHCTEDNLLFLSPQPGLAYTEALYNHPSYFSGEDDMYGLDGSDNRASAVAKIRVNEINSLLHQKSMGSISGKSFLEIGCGFGHTLAEAKNQGAIKADGVEFSKYAVKKCIDSGLKTKLGNVNEPPEEYLTDRSYDIVAAYSLVEHVSDPIALLSGLKGSLTKNGLLVIRVPKMSADGPWLSLIDHFWHFTSSSMKKSLEIAGFELLDEFSSGTFKGHIHGGSLESATYVARRKRISLFTAR